MNSKNKYITLFLASFYIIRNTYICNMNTAQHNVQPKPVTKIKFKRLKQLSKILGVTQHLLDQPCDYLSQIVLVNQLCLYWCYGFIFFFFRRDNMLEQEVVNLLEQTVDTVGTEVIISHQPGTGSLGFDGYWWYPSVPGAVSSFCHLTQSTVLCAILIQQVILINFKSSNITSKLHMHPTLPVYQRLMATLAGTTINQAY